MDKFKLGIGCVAFWTALSFAEILPETEGMQDTRADGTFLTASPTYVFDRDARSGGIHSGSEEWNPSKSRNRIFVNRMSETPSWTPLSPSVWISVGNEVGDLMYQDPLYGGKKSGQDNRTPLLEAGFRSPSYSGFWTTARFFQVDHYSNDVRRIREEVVDTKEFSIFGENLPFLSTAYAGLGFSANSFETSLLAGHEYVWIWGESSRWLPVEYRPRAEARFDSRYFQAALAFENAEYTVQAGSRVGNRKEWNGSLKLGEDSESAKKKLWNLALGVSFRVVDDSAYVPFGIEDDYVVFPFLEFSLNPTDRLKFAGFAGTSGREFAAKDSVNLEFSELSGAKMNVGFKNHFASSLNPLGEDEEYFDADTISLKTDGWMQLHRAYFDLRTLTRHFGLGMNLSGWIEKGAETFEVKKFVEKKSGRRSAVYRTGNVDRIDSWIRGFAGDADISFLYGKMFSLTAKAGFERIDGDEERFEVNPVEEWLSFEADWNLWNRFFIHHAWTYRSDAKWNLRTENPYVVKGGWYWNATISQKFPSTGISLSATILHAIGEDGIQVPNGGEDRTRFYCNAVKSF